MVGDSEKGRVNASVGVSGSGRGQLRSAFRRTATVLKSLVHATQSGYPLTRRQGVVAGAVLLTLLAGYGGYKAYEYSATGGVGFVQASEITLPDRVDVERKKRLFFAFLRPVVEAENAKVASLRERLVEARDGGEDPGWVADTAAAYDVDWTGDEWTALLKRVDIVPVQLALAQAAKESGWGQSRFAREGNNLFGEWCFREGCGIVPEQRAAGKAHEVAAFDTVNDSVRAYIHNINTTWAYDELRRHRWQARQRGEAPKALELAGGLSRYSERGAAYVDEIRGLIRENRDLMMSEVETASDS